MTEKKATKGWTKVPNVLIEMEDLPQYLFRVFCVIMAQKDGFSITLKELCKRSNLSKNTVLKAIQSFLTIGILIPSDKHGYANTYLPVKNLPVDNMLEKMIEQVKICTPKVVKNCTPKNPKTTKTSQNLNTRCSGIDQRVVKNCTLGSQNLNTHAREYIDINKTNNKTKTRLNNKNKECSAFKNFSFLDWQKEVAEKWSEHYLRVLPNMSKPHIEKWANEVRLIANAYNLTHEAFLTILRFVERDNFWRDKAESVMTLRKRNASGIPKIVNIMKAIPAFKSAAAEKAFADENLTNEQRETRRIMKEIGW